MHSFDGELKVIEKWEKAGFVFFLKDLENMGFLDWLIQRPPSPPQAQASRATRTSAEFTFTNHIDSQIIIAFNRSNWGVTSAGGSITTHVTMEGCSESVKLNVQGPSHTKWNCNYKTSPSDTRLVTGELTVYVPASLSSGKYELTITASDPNGRKGTTSYFLTVI